MQGIIQILSIASLVGCGLVGGLLFAFSNFVMQALCELPAEYGMRAMQRINVRILNTGFLSIFVGTGICSGALAVLCILRMEAAGSLWLLAGSLAYLLGPVLITATRNVPLNEALARAEESNAATEWPKYVRPWMRWNHVRVALAIIGILCLGVGLSRSA